MNGAVFEDAFAHHVWATTRLIDACLALNTKQLATAVSGTYGSIIETMRHLVEGDSDYLSIMTGDRTHLRSARHSRRSAWIHLASTPGPMVCK